MQSTFQRITTKSPKLSLILFPLFIRLKGALNYYQRKNGREIDFILDKKEAYEVKVRPTEQDMRRLTALGDDLSLNSVTTISKNYTELSNAMYGFLI